MSPTASIGHGLVVGLLLAALALFGWDREAMALLLGILTVPFVLSLKGRRAPKSADRGPAPYRRSEPARVFLAIATTAVPLIVVLTWPGDLAGSVHVREDKPAEAKSSSPGSSKAGLRQAEPRDETDRRPNSGHESSKAEARDEDTDAVVLAMTLIAIASAALVFFSGLIDWFYVRPHLRGVTGTVCTTSFAPRWKSVTRTWLLHRAAATLGPLTGVIAIGALAANAWIHPLSTGTVAAVATIIAGYYLTRAAPLLAIAINPPVQVGDVIEIAEEYNVHQPDRLREYFVVDVALEGVKLLHLSEEDLVRRTGRDADRTHDRTIDVVDIARLLRSRRPVQPCPTGCQKLTEHCACTAPWPMPPDPQSAGTADAGQDSAAA